MLNPEIILEALKNTTTKEGAKRAIAQVEPIFEDIENSFFGPQIYAELQRLKQLTTPPKIIPQCPICGAFLSKTKPGLHGTVAPGLADTAYYCKVGERLGTH